MKDQKFASLLLLTFFLLACITPPKTLAQVDDNTEEKLLRIAAIGITGNKKTREQFILQELTFKAGDSLTINELGDKVIQSRINLVNTSLFLNHFVSIDWFYISGNDLLVMINLQERWYLWPEPILQNAERNFNTWMAGRDFSKLSYGLNLIRENFRGRNERFTMLFQVGYDEKYEIAWHLPQAGHSQSLGFSIGAGLQENQEVAYGISDNKPVFIRENRQLLRHLYGFAQLNFRPAQRHFHTFRLSIGSYQADELLFVLNPFYTWGGENQWIQADFGYLLKLDYRNDKAYPLKGHYVDFEYVQHNIASVSAEQKSYATLEANLRKYVQLHHRLYFGTGAQVRFSSRKDLPFMFREGLGYGRSFVRGYEYNVIHGAHHLLIKENLKYALIPERWIGLPFMPHEKFRNGWFALYMNIFTDAGYVSDPVPGSQSLANRWLGCAGVGFDLVTYYDKVLRIELTLNDQQEAGVFVHFVAPI